MLIIPSRIGGFTIYSDTSRKSLGCALIQNEKIIVYAFGQLKSYELNYSTHNLELKAMIVTLKI